MWHAEVSSLVLRHYENRCGYELHLAFDGVAYAKSIGRGVMFIEGALRTDGAQLRLSDWRDLAILLLERFGVHTVKVDRRGKEVSFDTRRAIKTKES